MVSLMKSCCFGVQQRWVFAVMGFLALFNAYSMRSSLSIAIVEMVKPIDHSNTHHSEICIRTVSNTTNNGQKIKDVSKLYDWSEEQQGLILSSFYWGYVITHLPGGMLAERFGGKYSLGLGILSTAVFTLLTPWAVEVGEDKALIVLRVLMGLGEGITFPALNAMLAQWTPPEERSKIGSSVFAGTLLGNIVSTTVSGYILEYYGWKIVFYIFGGIGVIWFVFWMILCYNNPSEHPFISEKEYKYLNDRLQVALSKKPPPVPWRHILRSKPLMALICAQIGHDWGFFTMITDLPKYMSGVLKISIKENGWYSSLPYLTMWLCSIVTSWIADWLICRGYMSTTNVRKLGTTIASIGPGLLIIAASYAGCDQFMVITYFTLGMTLMGTFYPGMKVNALDLSPNYSGTLMALVNGIGAFTGIFTPYIVGLLTDEQTLSQWRVVFWIVLGVFIVTNLIFVTYASGEVQPWNDPDFLREEKEKRSNAKQITYDKKFERV